MADIRYGSVPFREQIDFFRGKDLVPSTDWTELFGPEHDSGFMVSRATSLDLLADLHTAIDKAASKGTTLAEFRKDFDATVERTGWTGWTGEANDAARAWRTRTIYETNLRASYGAGRWAQAQRVRALRPYGIYKHSDSVVTPRPLHLSWDGLILPLDDPWWQAHMPPNGWGCKCKMFTLSERDLARMGRSVDTAPDDGSREWVNPYTGELHDVPNGIDPGWDYAPGASRVDLLRERYRAKADGYEQRFAGEAGQRLAQYLREAIAPVPDQPAPRRPPVTMGQVSRGFAAGVRSGYDDMPEARRSSLESSGHRLVIARRLTDYAPYLMDQRPRGHAEDTTWLALDGVTTRDGVIVIAQEIETAPGVFERLPAGRGRAVLRHEVGHALDRIDPLSTRSDFRAAWAEDARALRGLTYRGDREAELRYFLQPPPVGYQETLAELVARLDGEYATTYLDVLLLFPQTAKTVQAWLEAHGWQT